MQRLLTLCLLAPASFAQSLATRVPLHVDQVKACALPSAALGMQGGASLELQAEHRLIVKFNDELLVRADAQGRLVSLAGVTMTGMDELHGDLGTSLIYSSLLVVDPTILNQLESRAAIRSGRAQADLAGMLIVDLDEASTKELERVGQALNDSPLVEWAWIELLNPAPPGDLAPTTPNLVGLQGHRGPDPGIDVNYAWSVGARGQGVRISDCEYGWDADHEDLNDINIHLEVGQTIPPFVFSNGWDKHGTAALGEIAAQDNAYGFSGIAPDADFYTWPENSVEQGSRRVTCITNAVAASSSGDIVMLEMQTTSGGGYGPAELSPAVWTVCSTATAAGVVVVGAAGNGNENLDSSNYSTYQSWGDSGAIIVGAGSPNTHNKLSFSTYGSRVNLQGWGTSVFTLGYGSYATYGGDSHQEYASGFNGTSSATPFVAGSCAAIQSYSLANGLPLLTSLELRSLLVSTGVSQGSGGHIGPLPNLHAAINGIDPCPIPQSYCGTTPNSVGPGVVLAWLGSTSLNANDASITAEVGPPGVFGLFFYGSAETSTPLGNGQLCVSGGGSGLIRLNPAQQTDVVGSVQTALDFTQAPFNSGPGQVGAGQSVRWQYWYRDPSGGGAGFNLSDALRVIYCP
jgi:hypothetical protein